MWRTSVLGVCLALVIGSAGILAAQDSLSGLVPRTVAAQHGLVMNWHAQIDMARSQARVGSVNLFSGIILAQTDQGTIHALDAESGHTLWAQQFGERSRPTMAAGANSQYVAAVNGSTLYVVDRVSGELKWTRGLSSSPSAGPALTEDIVYVPLRRGAIEFFNLKKPQKFAMSYSSAGRGEAEPLATNDSLIWTTDRGRLYVAQHGGYPMRFKFDAQGGIVSRPTFDEPFICFGTLSGYVYSIHEMRGNIRWRYLAGAPIRQSPVAARGAVYAVTEDSGMFCINGETGREAWWAPRIARFLSASPTRVYVTDPAGRLNILDARTGSVLGALANTGYSVSPVNTRNDRIYLATDTGVIQSLREFELEQPSDYSQPPPAPEKKSVVPPKSTEEGEATGTVPEGSAPAEPDAAGVAPAGAGADNAAPPQQPVVQTAPANRLPTPRPMNPQAPTRIRY